MIALCAAVILGYQAPSQQEAKPHDPAQQVELRFKPAAGERLRYRLRNESVTKKSPSGLEVDVLVTVKEHIPERITAELVYERIKLTTGERDSAVSYDSTIEPTNEREEIIASWVKPLLAQKFTVVCDGRGTLAKIEGMFADAMEAINNSPTETPQGPEQIRKVGKPAVGLAVLVVRLRSPEMRAMIGRIFRPGVSAPERAAENQTWKDKEQRLEFKVERVVRDTVTIRASRMEDAPHPSGEDTETSDVIEWSTRSGTLVSEHSLFQVVKSGGGPGAFTPGDKIEWKIERLPETAAPGVRPESSK